MTDTPKPSKSNKADDALFFLLLVPFMLLSAFSLQCIWGWYAPLVWATAPILSFKQSFCLIMVRSVLIPPAKQCKEPGESALHTIGKAFVLQIIWLCLSWLIYRLFLA